MTEAADPAAMLQAARRGVDAVMRRMRDEPARIGRARIFADRSVGMDDPGMVAFAELLAGLAHDA